MGLEVQRDIAQSSFLREVFSGKVRSFDLLLREVGSSEDDGVEPAYSDLRVKGHRELLLRSRPDGGHLRINSEAGVLALLGLDSCEIKFKWIFAFVKACVLSNRYLERVLANLSEVLLVE